MQLASHGGRASIRQASNLLPRTNVRSIHIPRKPTLPVPGTTQKFLSGSRQLFSRFVAHLTAPGLRAPVPNHSFVRAAHTTAQAGIRNGLSLPVRLALSRPLGAPALPRAPAIPRGITHVGLGTARNFHSSRPIFQNLVENVPIAGRAFFEADWDIKMRNEKENMLRTVSNGKKSSRKPKALKISQPKINLPYVEKRLEETVGPSSEVDHYFKDVTPAVVTVLLIPLMPTSSTRMPLSAERIEGGRFLPLPELGSIHDTHSVHALRVSSLFSRLDAANVWEKGVHCSALAQGHPTFLQSDSTCTILKVEFNGWTKAEVRSVIGESGSGWCVLEETSNGDDNESLFSDSICSHDDEDVAQTLVFPTLDMSMTSIPPPSPQSASSSSTPSISEFFDEDGFDFSSAWASEHSLIQPPSPGGYFAFSSSFSERMSSCGWEDIDQSRRPPDMLF